MVFGLGRISGELVRATFALRFTRFAAVLAKYLQAIPCQVSSGLCIALPSYKSCWWHLFGWRPCALFRSTSQNQVLYLSTSGRLVLETSPPSLRRDHGSTSIVLFALVKGARVISSGLLHGLGVRWLLWVTSWAPPPFSPMGDPLEGPCANARLRKVSKRTM